LGLHVFSISSSRGKRWDAELDDLPTAVALNWSQCWDLTAGSLGSQLPPSQTHCEPVLCILPAFPAAKHSKLPAAKCLMPSASLVCFIRAEGNWEEETISSHRCGKLPLSTDFLRWQQQETSFI